MTQIRDGSNIQYAIVSFAALFCHNFIIKASTLYFVAGYHKNVPLLHQKSDKKLWNESQYSLEHIKEELADVLNYCIRMTSVWIWTSEIVLQERRRGCDHF